MSGKTFSNASGAGITGSMPNNGAVTLTPGTTDQAIPAGYHNGSGKVVGDADLTAGNIRQGSEYLRGDRRIQGMDVYGDADA